MSKLIHSFALAKTHLHNGVTQSNFDILSLYKKGVVKFQHFTNSVISVFSRTGMATPILFFNIKINIDFNYE